MDTPSTLTTLRPRADSRPRAAGTPVPRPSISARSLGKRFGRNIVLDGLDLDLYPGQFTALAGPSGAGKSTLLNLLAGLDSPTSGSVSAPRRQDRGFVFQDYNLLESLSARDNALLSARLLGRRSARADVEATFERLGLRGLERRLPHQLSGGQQQRVAIARVLLARVPFVFADEPTGALDADSAAVVMGELRAAADAGATVVMVSHSPSSLAIADRVVELGGGRR